MRTMKLSFYLLGRNERFHELENVGGQDAGDIQHLVQELRSLTLQGTCRLLICEQREKGTWY